MEVDKDRATNLLTKLKSDIRELLNKYASEASAVAVNSTDPHTPIIGCVQMALANASVDYLLLCGATPSESYRLTVISSGNAMEYWAKAIMKLAANHTEDVKNKTN